MKKLTILGILGLAALCSCKTAQIGISKAEITYENGRFCYNQVASAAIPEDSFKQVLEEGVLLGSDSVGIMVNYKNGVLSVRPRACYKP